MIFLYLLLWFAGFGITVGLLDSNALWFWGGVISLCIAIVKVYRERSNEKTKSS